MSAAFLLPIALVLFPVVIGLVVGAIVLLVRAKPVVRRIIGGVLAAVVLLVLGLAVTVLTSWGTFVEYSGQTGQYSEQTFGRPSPPSPPRPIITPMHPDDVEAILAPPPSEAWQPTVDKTFEADVYPSPRAAAKALARKLAPLLSQVTPDDQTPSIIQLSGRDLLQSDPGLIVADVAEVLRQEIESAQVLIESATPTSSIERVDPDAVSIRIDLPDRTTRHGTSWDPSFQELAGAIRAQLRGAGAGQLSCDVRFIDKPWVHDYATFISTRPNGQWLKAESLQLAGSQHEAEQSAIAAAAELLSQTAWDAVRQETRPHAVMVQSRQQIAAALRPALRRGEFIVDRFAQRLSKSYGDFWREAILLDASPAKLQAFARQHAGAVRLEHAVLRTSLWGRGFSIAGLVLFICVVYGVLNLATKGYYAWSLRLTLLVIAAAGVVLVLFTA